MLASHCLFRSGLRSRSFRFARNRVVGPVPGSVSDSPSSITTTMFSGFGFSTAGNRSSNTSREEDRAQAHGPFVAFGHWFAWPLLWPLMRIPYFVFECTGISRCAHSWESARSVGLGYRYIEEGDEPIGSRGRIARHEVTSPPWRARDSASSARCRLRIGGSPSRSEDCRNALVLIVGRCNEDAASV